LFTSKAFYAPQWIGAQIKSPIQLLVGTARMLDVDLPPGRMLLQPNGPLNQMGQVPFMPPNVKGWPGGRMWISTSTLFVRYNTAVFLAGGSMPDVRMGRLGNKGGLRVGGETSGSFRPQDVQGSPQQMVDAWINRLIQRPV